MRVLGPAGRWAVERMVRAVLLLAAGVAMAGLAGCTDSSASADEEPVLGSDTTLVAVSDGEQAAGRDTEGGAGSRLGDGAPEDPQDEPGPGDPAEAVGEVLDRVAAGVEQAPPGMEEFFDSATEERIDELATTICEQMTTELSLAELGALTASGWEDLTPTERARIDLGAYRVAIGVMAGVYCPERLPVAAEVILADVALGDPDAYRDALPALLGADHQAVEFVEALTDRRLDRIQDRACAAVERAATIADLGVIVLDQYDDTLTSREREEIDFGDFLDLVGSLLGWFCPGSIALPLTS